MAEVSEYTSPTPSLQAQMTLPPNSSTWTEPVVQLYAQMYDEVKVDGIYYEITVTNVLGFEGLLNALRVYTCWDRKLTYNDTYYTDGRFPNASNIMTSGSVQTSTFGNNSVTTCYRACRASDFLEKYSFIDATTAAASGSVAGANCRFACNEGWFNAAAALSIFCPALMMCISNEADYPSADEIPFAISIKQTCYYTFRCPKWAGAGAAASSKSRQRLVVTKPGILLPEAERVGVCPKEELSLVLDEQTQMEDAVLDTRGATAAAATAGDQVQLNVTPLKAEPRTIIS